ncbi:hypothetical protein [Pedobacter frigiditerrae]|uniref:hypothetical protein n=1 Tax=Pedobacter frigiditerrae TaxID=2530452 RepID=UPI00292E7F2D|nr:hypothetical protein [Pedobacter frigiditerrae]
MTYLEALYGSQYDEIKRNGKDGNKGRLNGNIFLTAFLIMFLTTAILALCYFVPQISNGLGRMLRNIFGNNGKATGKLLAVIFGGLIYFIINKTIGTQENFTHYVDNFLAYPEDTRNKAAKMLLVPFFIVLALMFVLAFLN